MLYICLWCIPFLYFKFGYVKNLQLNKYVLYIDSYKLLKFRSEGKRHKTLGNSIFIR